MLLTIRMVWHDVTVLRYWMSVRVGTVRWQPFNLARACVNHGYTDGNKTTRDSNGICNTHEITNCTIVICIAYQGAIPSSKWHTDTNRYSIIITSPRWKPSCVNG